MLSSSGSGGLEIVRASSGAARGPRRTSRQAQGARRFALRPPPLYSIREFDYDFTNYDFNNPWISRTTLELHPSGKVLLNDKSRVAVSEITVGELKITFPYQYSPLACSTWSNHGGCDARVMTPRLVCRFPLGYVQHIEQQHMRHDVHVMRVILYYMICVYTYIYIYIYIYIYKYIY